jgi:hypothetical protein
VLATAEELLARDASDEVSDVLGVFALHECGRHRPEA